MPRLVGQRSNGGLYAGLLVAIALATATLIEYVGIIDVMPRFGREQRAEQPFETSTETTANAATGDQ